MRVEQALRMAKRFVIDELGANYNSVRPLSASLDDNIAKWTITCEYTYSPYFMAEDKRGVVKIIIDNTSGIIDTFTQVE